MTGTPRRRRRPALTRTLMRSSWIVGVLGSLLALATLGTAVQQTSSAWTNGAYFTSSASSGSWFPDPISPGPGVSASWVWSKNDNANRDIQVCAQITITTTSTTLIDWTVTFNTAAPPWNGNTNLSQYYFSGSYGLKTDLTNGVLQFGNQPGQTQVSSDNPLTVTICNDHLTPIAASASSSYYTVTTTQGTWTPSQACVVTTIQGNGTQQFYFDWSAALDMSSAITLVQPGSMSIDPWLVTATPQLSTTTSSYVLTGGTSKNPTAGAIAGSQSIVATVCANQ